MRFLQSLREFGFSTLGSRNNSEPKATGAVPTCPVLAHLLEIARTIKVESEHSLALGSSQFGTGKLWFHAALAVFQTLRLGAAL